MSERKKETRLIKFVKRGIRIMKRARTPFRSSKYSNHIYNNYVHLIFLSLRALSGMSYQVFIQWIENFGELLVILRIKQFPHFTTLQKFAGRVPRRYLDILIVAATKGPELRTLVTGIDSTGFSLTNASRHYIMVLDRYQRNGKRGRPPKKRKVRRYLKTLFIGETRTQKILAVGIRRGPDNDYKDFIPAYKKHSLLDRRPLKIIVADKGFDSEDNHRYARDELGAHSIIPARSYNSPEYTTRGRYRREMRAGYSKADYHQRCKMETINSVIKRRMGSSIRARYCRYQNIEMLFKALAYNLERGVSCVYIVGFLDSPCAEKHSRSFRARSLLRSVSFAAAGPERGRGIARVAIES